MRLLFVYAKSRKAFDFYKKARQNIDIYRYFVYNKFSEYVDDV